MFEYTALVDAPIRRFTGIVTGHDPADEPVQLAVRSSAEPVALMAAPAPAATRTFEPPRMPESSTALVPAQPTPLVPTLIAIAAAGITAMWWLRRESHGR